MAVDRMRVAPTCLAALIDRVVPVLDAPPKIEHQVEEVGDVPCGVDVGHARPQLPIDQHAVVDFDAAAAQPVGVRTHADAGNDEIALQPLPVLERDRLDGAIAALEASNQALQNMDAFVRVQRLEEACD